MVPDQLPDSLSKRTRAMKSVRENLATAVMRLNGFVEGKNRDEIIRKVHTAKTEIVNNNDETEIVPYFSLWTDFADMRITTNSDELLRNDAPIEEKLSDMNEYGFDKSKVVTLYELRTNEKEYTVTRLLSLAQALEKFLPETK